MAPRRTSRSTPRNLACACALLCTACLVTPLLFATLWLTWNPRLAKALGDLRLALQPEKCEPTPGEICNSFDAVDKLGEHFLSTTAHEPAFDSRAFPWTKTLREHYDVFLEEYVAYSREMRVPLQAEQSGSQARLATGVEWRTVPLRLSYHDTDFSRHFPRSMKLIRASGVDAFSVYIHFMARRFGSGDPSPSKRVSSHRAPSCERHHPSNASPVSPRRAQASPCRPSVDARAAFLLRSSPSDLTSRA